MESSNQNHTVIINGETYCLTLANNHTAQAFAKLLPATFDMAELNGNEKYIYLDTTLPAQPSIPRQIQAGDIMLYGNDCIVIFYKTFRTTYRYTHLGHIAHLPNLGPDGITVQFQ